MKLIMVINFITSIFVKYYFNMKSVCIYDLFYIILVWC